jgi:hypothetical protein
MVSTGCVSPGNKLSSRPKLPIPKGTTSGVEELLQKRKEPHPAKNEPRPGA